MRPSIDLNADLGEGFGSWAMAEDTAMLGLVTSANIACGFHAGDPLTMRTTAAAAVSSGVSVGAHVAYRDLAGFGRRFLDASEEELAADVLIQLGALHAATAVAGGEIRYVKPHGALYHACASYEPHARAVASAVAEFSELLGHTLPVLLAPGPRSSRVLGHRYAEQAGLPVVREVFADRAYTREGTLLSRREPGAVVESVPQVVEAMQRYVEEGVVLAADGTRCELEAETICLHGDTPAAVEMARSVRAALEGADVRLVSFA